MARRLHIDSDDSQLYSFVAVVTHLPDYRFIYLVNRDLKMSFSRVSDLPVFLEKEGNTLTFPLFYYEDELNRQEFYCIGCRNAGLSLMPELRQHDFLFIRLGESKLFDSKDLADKIKYINEVIMSTSMSYSSLKPIPGVLVDLEMHMTTLQREEKERNDPRLLRKRFVPPNE
jgi:hypothetical protein